MTPKMALSNSAKLRCQCVFCDKSFSSEFQLNRHLLAHSQENPFHCRFCKLELRHKESFIKHLAKVHSKDVKLSGKGKSKNWDRIKSNYERCCRNTCVFCNKCFVQKCILQSHIRTHTGERPYPCKKCYRTFTQGRLLRSHYQWYHGVYQTLYECELCSKRYKDKTGLRRHFHSQHPGKPRSFQTLKLKRKSTVQNNQRRQVNVGPVKCQECGKRVHTTHALKCHYKLCHPEQKFTLKIIDPVLNKNIETRHKCVFCGKGFFNSAFLTPHLKTKIGERPYFCRVCGKELKEKSCLRNHLFKTHKILPKGIENSTKRNENPERYCRLSCVFCQKFFTDNLALDGHIRTHINERPFQCPYCRKGLTRKYYLKRHIRIFHPDGHKSKLIAKIKKSSLDGNISSDNKSGGAGTSQHNNFNEQSTSFNIENCRAGNCRWCNKAVQSLPFRRFTFICPEPDPTGNDPVVRCGRKFKCLYQMALHFRDDHRIPIFQNVK